MNQRSSFGGFVRQRRREMDLTQDELARRVGCAAITLRKIEADDLRASVQIAERLAMALAIPLEERADFVRWARSVRPASSELPPVTPPPSMEEIGSEDLTGRAIRGYALAERIGMGGMGSVYRAVQPNVEREVAVKIILPAFANHPDFIRRFESEAQLVARLEHPHIVPLYDYWREPGVAYLIMRLLRGGNIQNLLGQGPLSIETTTHMLEQICSALNAAHRIGVIHRDLKPANVLLDEDSNAYLADFGIAKNLGDPDIENQTQIDAIIGSPQYMSPEQIRSLSVRPQTDVYCLGVMLYEMLTGALPFAGPTPFDMIQQHINTPMPPLSAHQAGLPAALDVVIGRATAKDLQERYADTLSFFNDFRQAIVGIVDAHPVTIMYEEEDINIEITNPFKSLRAFNEADAENFFGRETLIQQLLARLGEGGELSRFLAVIGPSGSGKSSVVRAGLIPALRRGGLPGSENWFIVDMLPGKHPFEELEASLLRVAVNPPESLLSQLKDGNRGLLRAVHRILPADESVELTLVIDQFEEVFTLIENEAERASLLESLATAALDERSRLRVIITLRADFTDKPLRYVDFGELLNRRFEFVLPLTADEVERAVAGPAQRVGLRLEKGLVSTIIREAGNQPGALPLLQYALSELFEKREGRTLTNKAYREIGGVLGALGRSAEIIYANLDEAGQSAARQLFLRLVTLGEGTEDTRRRVLRAELENLTADGGRQTAVNGWLSAVIDAFGKARLLSFDRDPTTRGATIEVAHEALLREWTRLREWLNDSRADVRLQRQLATAAHEWENARQDKSFLLTGAHLEQFEGWAENTIVALTQIERAFLEASIQERDRRASEEQARQQRELEAAQKLVETEKQAATRLRVRNRVITVVASIAVILAMLAGMYGVRAENEKKVAISRELAIAAVNNLEVDPQRSILLALQAVSITRDADKSVLPEAESALHRAVQASRVLRIIHAHTDMIYGLDISQDGKRLASGSDDGTAKIWDTVSGEELLTLNVQSGEVTNVAFSPDGALLATTSSDGKARIWDAWNGRELLTLAKHDGPVHGIAFSPDGMRIVTSGADGIAIVWQTTTGKPLLTLRGHNDAIWKVVYSPDGTRILTGSFDQTAKVWDAEDGKELLTLAGHTWNVETVAFSPDGKQILTGSTDITAKLWDAANGTELLTYAGHDRAVYGGVFSPDGKRIATASDDGTAKVWDASTGKTLITLAGHDGSVTRVRFMPDGNRLVTSGVDGTLRVWDLSPERDAELFALPGQYSREDTFFAFNPDWTRIAANDTAGTIRIWSTDSNQELVMIPHTDEWHVWTVAFSPDGKRLITSGVDNLAKVWDAESGQQLLTLTGHGEATMMSWMFSGVMAAAFSPDETRIATAGIDQTARIWDAATGRQLLVLTGHTGGVLTIAFSPDGTKVATSAEDTTVRIWDAKTGREMLILRGHPGTVWGLAYSPDGTRLATVGFGGTVKVWNANTGEELFNLSGHDGDVVWVTFSPDGSLLATSDYDDTVRLWDMNSGEERLNIPGRWQVFFSPDGTRLATGGDNYVRIYLLRIEELVALARSRLTRSWATEECRTYLHVEACPTEP